jgi:Mrp family chromosome partitioning ATPase
MTTITETAVFDALRQVQEPELGGDLVTRNMIRDLTIDGSDVAFTIELTTPACPLKDEIETNVRAALGPLGVETVAIAWGATVRRAAPAQPQQLVPGVKNIIAVASGKGGVGKSTVSVNLAVALAQAGAAVGLLDADITGPNIPLMMGLEGQPKASANNKITPLERYGVKVISIQFFVPEGQPIVWRGPLVGGAIQQFLRDVDWGDLDYLVIDLPPGTSDAQLTLAQAGAKVGLLDADITGPNIPMMLGVQGQPKASENNKITPLERHGVKCISIQFFVPEGQPIVWRGPLVGGAIQQFLRDVDWGDLDYLVVDLPPGPSDAQLTLAQSVPLSGAVLVTTPQEVALSDVGKALAMFKRLSVPILGLVENMTAFACPHCGELTEIFGRGGGERFCQEHGIDFLGGVPLDVTVRQGGDVGVPAVAQREPGPAARALTAVAGAVAARMSVRAAGADQQPLLSIS